jgi:RES domain-containing protein
LFRVILPDRQLRRIIAETLPEDWNAYPYPESTQLVGDAWMERGEAVALAVPSVLAPQEHNVVLNCEHPAFADLRIEGPEDFPFDPRLAPDARWQ